MQTFLPYASFRKTASVLDNRRLGKQRVEAMQIMQCLMVKETRWKNHPAVKMWKGYECALLHYALAICSEWKSRGYRDTVMDKSIAIYRNAFPNGTIGARPGRYPHWFRSKAFHKAHRSNLLRKDFVYYSKYFKDVDASLPYVWPSNEKSQDTL